MKKLILFSIVAISLSFTFCGGKEMNDPADSSNVGPCYKNESELAWMKGKDTCCSHKH